MKIPEGYEAVPTDSEGYGDVQAGDKWLIEGEGVSVTGFIGRHKIRFSSQIMIRPIKTMKPNKDAIRKAIEAIPICTEGKKAVTNLVQEIIGDKLEEERYYYGEKFTIDDGDVYILAHLGEQAALINIKTGFRWMEQQEVDWKYATRGSYIEQSDFVKIAGDTYGIKRA